MNLQQLIELQRLNARPVRRPFGSHSKPPRKPPNVWTWLLVCLLAVALGGTAAVLFVLVARGGFPL